MSDPRWRRIEEICHDALARPTDDRAAFVREACDGDAALCVEVESLLANQSRADALGSGLGIRDAGLGISTEELIGKQIGVYKVISLLFRAKCATTARRQLGSATTSSSLLRRGLHTRRSCA